MGWISCWIFPTKTRTMTKTNLRRQMLATRHDPTTSGTVPFSISNWQISQSLANEIDIKRASKYLCTLEENLLTRGLIFVLRSEVRKLAYWTYWQGVLEGVLLDGHMKEPDWKNYLQSNMRVIGDERELYFVFSLSHLSPPFLVLVFGYVLT